jgi:hypothetical protein
VSTQELLIGELAVVADCVELLCRRRASGEITSLYPELSDMADTLMYLRNDAPQFLQAELSALQSRCSRLLRSIAN